MLLLGLLLLMLKPSFGFITVPLAGFLIFLVLRNMSQRAEILAASTITDTKLGPLWAHGS